MTLTPSPRPPEPREPVAPTDPLAAHRGAGGGLFGTHYDDPVGALMQLAYNWTHEPTFTWDNPRAAKLEAALHAVLFAASQAPAHQGIPQGVEARNAARFRWLSEHFLGADFDWGADSESGTAGTPVLLIQIGSALVYGDLGLTVDEAMGATISQGEQKP